MRANVLCPKLFVFNGDDSLMVQRPQQIAYHHDEGRHGEVARQAVANHAHKEMQARLRIVEQQRQIREEYAQGGREQQRTQNAEKQLHPLFLETHTQYPAVEEKQPAYFDETEKTVHQDAPKDEPENSSNAIAQVLASHRW